MKKNEIDTLIIFLKQKLKQTKSSFNDDDPKMIKKNNNDIYFFTKKIIDTLNKN